MTHYKKLASSNRNRLFPYKEFFPKISLDVFLASGVKIVGDVEILEGSSVWYNTVIRGDVNYIRIGSLTNVQIIVYCTSLVKIRWL